MSKDYSLEEILRLGEKFYVEKLKDKLEKKYKGQYAVIDVENKRYVVNQEKLKAIEKANQKFGKKLFFIVQIGEIETTINLKNVRYAWKF